MDDYGKTSVIIPVYNSEQYLVRCLDSILKQTFTDLEIILVDDGSTDSSPEICEKYHKKNDRIHVIHKENGGSTSARKAGVRTANGEYIAFIDSDDWIDEIFCERLYHKANTHQADIAVSGCVKEGNCQRQELVNNFPEGYYSKQDLKKYVYPKMLYYEDMNFFSFGIRQYLWGKLFRRSVIEQCIYSLDERLYDGEDVACVYDACLRASSIVIDNHTYYHYNIHEGSVCTSVRDERYFANAVYLYQYMMGIFQKSEEREILMPQLKHFISMFMNNGMIAAFECGYQKSYAAANWKLPDLLIHEKCRLAIFGAGTKGFSYYKQLLDYENVEIVLWVDSIAHGKKIGGVCIESPEVLKEAEWDYILIAVRNASDREEIIKKLGAMGITKEKILYREAERSSGLYEFCL